MALKTKLVIALLGLASLAVGFWPLGLLCFILLLIPRRPKGLRTLSGAPQGKGRFPWRYLLGSAFLLLSALALASGGTLSPPVFFSAGALALLGPSLAQRTRLGGLAPVEDSILLKSKYLPFSWHALAELKPGTESYPRAASSLRGSLLLFAETGRVYVHAACLALGPRDAEDKLLHQFRSSSAMTRAGAYLLPLDSASAASLLMVNLFRARLSHDSFADSASEVSGVLVFECQGSLIRRGAAYEIEGAAALPRLPSGGADLRDPPLLWEVLERLGKRTRWPDPDSLSNLLDSLAATKGAPIGERFKALAADGNALTVQSLGGEEVRVSRSQLRAILSIYA